MNARRLQRNINEVKQIVVGFIHSKVALTVMVTLSKDWDSAVKLSMVAANANNYTLKSMYFHFVDNQDGLLTNLRLIPINMHCEFFLR